MESRVSPIAVALLDVAIGSDDANCAATGVSTEDEKILAVLRERDFEIVDYAPVSDHGEAGHRFILKHRRSRMRLSADVVAVRGQCSTYTFGGIAQAEQDLRLAGNRLATAAHAPDLP